jgi:hypothetical protein
MALTRKSLKAMGLTDEQVDSIVEMHTETVDGLKDKLKTAEEKANKLDDVQKELDGLKANPGDDWKSKYEKEHSDFETYKKDVTAKETKAAKEKAVKAYFESHNITGANLDIAMRGCRDEIGAIELDGDKIKDTAALDALVNGTFAGLAVTKTVQGAQTANPPANNGGKNYKTKEEILAIKDRAERQNAIAENHEMFGF